MSVDAPIGSVRQPIALALGAGGARGLAQIGVIEVLVERGFDVAAVAGTSSGALVGGVLAAGRLREFADALLAMSRGDVLGLLDPAVGRPGMFRGDRLVEAMRAIVGDPDIASLPMQFTAVAVDLEQQREVWLRSGPLWDAIRASFAVPGVFTPHVVGGRALVDGGLLAPLPIAATRVSGAQRLVAVNMHGWPKRSPPQPAPAVIDGAVAMPRERSAGKPSRRFARWLDLRLGNDPDEASIAETLARSLDTMQAQMARVQLALHPPELVIDIPRDACLTHEFWRAKELIALGRAQATKALDRAGS